MPTIKHQAVAVAAVAFLSLPLAACGSEDEPAAEATSQAPADDTASPVADLVGPGCADYAEAVPDGAGSIEGMAQDPLATAASNNPQLKILTAAVSGKLNPDVDLVDTLNGEEFTVFAPVDSAFTKLPDETMKTLGTPEGAEALERVLTYHVVPGRLAPDEVAGKHETANGAEVTVEGEGDRLTVDDASVVCGGVQTANATVYLIDSVLMPPG